MPNWTADTDELMSFVADAAYVRVFYNSPLIKRDNFNVENVFDSSTEELKPSGSVSSLLEPKK